MASDMFGFGKRRKEEDKKNKIENQERYTDVDDLHKSMLILDYLKDLVTIRMAQLVELMDDDETHDVRRRSLMDNCIERIGMLRAIVGAVALATEMTARHGPDAKLMMMEIGPNEPESLEPKDIRHRCEHTCFMVVKLTDIVVTPGDEEDLISEEIVDSLWEQGTCDAVKHFTANMVDVWMQFRHIEVV